MDQRPFTGNARSTVGTASDIAPLLRMLFSRAGVPNAGYSPAYSFNDPSGMCLGCEGIGTIDDIDLNELLDQSLSLNQGAIRFPTFAPGTYRWKRMVHSGLIDPDLPLSRTPEETLHTLLFAEGLRLSHPGSEYPKSGTFDGIVPRLRDSYLRKAPARLTKQERAGLDRVVTRRTCPDCGGARVNVAARASLLNGLSIVDWSAMPISALRSIAGSIRDPRVRPVIEAILERLDAMDDIGLGYLSLDRLSTTLSGGEAQRVRIVRHLGSALSDVCYVFDEPSVGLHPHDVHRLLSLLTRLREAGNTILVVDHHPAVIAAADHVIDLGPGAGAEGGHVLFTGTPGALASTTTATGRMLYAPVRINDRPRRPAGTITIAHASAHNLRDVTVEIPLGVLTVISGVAGSGKSTLAAAVLPDQHPEFTVIAQMALRGGSRSTAATALGIAEPIREVFATANEMSASWFSANSRGACPVCNGKGVIVTDLAFLEDVRTPCEACCGTHFNSTALAARIQGHTIAEVFAMTADDARDLFADHGDIARRLSWLTEIGLGYLTIGQATNTLSGGERQRLLLAQHLAEAGPAAGLRMVLDEPTAGLHGNDTDRLLFLFDRLIDEGATIVAIEHNQRVIAHADHVIDIGPGAGHDGGTVIYQGAPTGLLASVPSVTGRYLRRAAATSRRREATLKR